MMVENLLKNSEEFTNFWENLNIRSTAPAESPRSTGICEWHNGILIELLQAVNAKNSFINVSGFSPY